MHSNKLNLFRGDFHKHNQMALAKEYNNPVAYLYIFDAEKIRTVLMNLLSNAVKFTNKGEIKVTLEKRGTMP